MIFNLTSIPATVWASGDVPEYRFTQGGAFLRLAAFKAKDPDRPHKPRIWYWWMTRAHLTDERTIDKDTPLLVIPPEALTPVSGPPIHRSVLVSETQQIFGRAGDIQAMVSGAHILISETWMQIARICAVCAPPLRTREPLYAGPRHAAYPIWSHTQARWIDPVQPWDQQ